jgi:hypothetical protein
MLWGPERSWYQPKVSTQIARISRTVPVKKVPAMNCVLALMPPCQNDFFLMTPSNVMLCFPNIAENISVKQYIQPQGVSKKAVQL